MNRRPFLCFCFVVAFLFLSLCNDGYSQSKFAIRRILQKGSLTTVAFDARCDGVWVDDLKRTDLIVTEDGVNVDDYLLARQHMEEPESFSIVFALDISGSMSGFYNGTIPGGAGTLLDLFDRKRDEAAVVTVGEKPGLALPFTMLTSRIYKELDTVRNEGIAALYDGLYYAADYSARIAHNDRKAVILFTDCDPGENQHSYPETLELAAMHGIQIFIVSFSDVASGSDFIRLAENSGGAFFTSVNNEGMDQIFLEIYRQLRYGNEEYTITYPSACRDGQWHRIELKMGNFCGKERLAADGYRQSLDSAIFQPVTISTGTIGAYSGDTVLVPVWISPFPAIRIPAFTASFNWDTASIGTPSIETAGTQLEAIPVGFSTGKGVMNLTLNRQIQANPAKPLLYIKMPILAGTPSGRHIAYRLSNWKFTTGCLLPVMIPGEAVILPHGKPYITASGHSIFCEGDSVELTCPEGFRSYHWSNGGQTPSIWITQSGSYWVETEDGLGNRSMSDTVVFLALQALKPEISNLGPVEICRGGHTTLTAIMDYPSYRWSNGASTKTIDVTETGVYYLETCNENGCWTRSNDIQITVRDPVPHAILGPVNFCDTAATARYTVQSQPGYAYKWDVKGGTIAGAADSDTLDVRWTPARMCSVLLESTDMATGCVSVSELFVNTDILQPGLNLYQAVICGGDSIRIFVKEPYEKYLWNTGDTSSSIIVRKTGPYYCRVTDGECKGSTHVAQVYCIDSVALAIPYIHPVCVGQYQRYEVKAIPGVGYTWSVKHGKQQYSGQPNVFNVIWSDAGIDTLTVSIRYQQCVRERVYPIIIYPAAVLNARVLASESLCDGDTLWIEADSGFANYSWNTGANTRIIPVTMMGGYTVYAASTNGCMYSATVNVAFRPRPSKPTFVRMGNKLIFQNVSLQCEWYYNDSLMPGEISNSIVLRNPGRYRLRVTNSNGCSNISDEYVVKDTIGSHATVAVDFRMMPNPNNGRFIVQAEFRTALRYLITVSNPAGKVVYTEQPAQQVYSIDKTMDLTGLPPGVYLFRMDYSGASVFRKLVITE